jgi:hypothetical protein
VNRFTCRSRSKLQEQPKILIFEPFPCSSPVNDSQ